MGFFDDLLKNVDKGLKAVESGALEERLTKFADTIDKTSQQASKTIEKAADKPAELLKTAEQKKEVIENRAKDVQQHVKRNIDIIQKRG